MQADFGEVWLLGVHFTNHFNGWVVGVAGLIMYTTDGGNSWLRQTTNVEASLNDVVFLNHNEGWGQSAEKVSSFTPLTVVETGVHNGAKLAIILTQST